MTETKVEMCTRAGSSLASQLDARAWCAHFSAYAHLCIVMIPVRAYTEGAPALLRLLTTSYFCPYVHVRTLRMYVVRMSACVRPVRRTLKITCRDVRSNAKLHGHLPNFIGNCPMTGSYHKHCTGGHKSTPFESYGVPTCT